MKKVFGGATVLALALLIGINVNINAQNDGASMITLANVEALAADEPPASCTGPKVEASDGRLYCKSENTNPCTDVHGCN